MSEFLQAVTQYEFLQRALLTGLLASIACGVIGTYVVVRRITYIAGAIAHAVLGGLGAARFFEVNYGWEWLHPLHGAVVAALLPALLIGWVSLRAKQREDTVIGAIWAVGMAIGVLFIFKTQTYNQDLMSYLFGNILMVTPADVWLVGGLDVLVVALAALFYNQFLAVCFDEQFARLRGLHVEAYYLLLLCLTALTVVLLITVVGIILVIALLTLPVAIAGNFARTLLGTMILAAVLSVALTTAGLALSYGPDLPAGATTIVLAGATYLLVLAGRAVLGLLRRVRRAPRMANGA
jgi:zinc transport system permease protein